MSDRLNCPGCGRTHRTWYALARCRWRRGLAWVAGNPSADGPCYALVASCGHLVNRRVEPAITVTLWEDRAEAEARKRLIDGHGCGNRCSRQHQIYALHEGRGGNVSCS